MNGTPPTPHELPLPMSTPEITAKSPESASGIEVKNGSDGMSQGPSTPMPMVDPSQFTSAPATTAVIGDDQVAADIASDEDVIEKEWVTKAKAIVNSTRDNPRDQSKQLGDFKAAYIKKRFNKEVKTAKETGEDLVA